MVPLPSFELGYPPYEEGTMANTVPAALMVQPLWIEQSSSALQADVSTSFTKVALLVLEERIELPTSSV
jgi:hypothetical protein